MRYKEPWPPRPEPPPGQSAQGLLRMLLEVSGQHSGDYRVTNVLVSAHDRLKHAIGSRDLDAIRAAMDGARAALRACPTPPGGGIVA